MSKPIGTIGNTYGGLVIREEGGKFYWSIEDCLGNYWEEIPEILYRALDEYENKRERR